MNETVRIGIHPARKSIAAALAVLGCLAGCRYLAEPVAYRAEYARLKSEAERRFPPSSEAAAFESWFAGKSASKLVMRNPSLSTAPLADSQCEPRIMRLERVEGCMNIMTADYCVDKAGKLAKLVFSDGGHC